MKMLCILSTGNSVFAVGQDYEFQGYQPRFFDLDLTAEIVVDGVAHLAIKVMDECFAWYGVGSSGAVFKAEPTDEEVRVRQMQEQALLNAAHPMMRVGLPDDDDPHYLAWLKSKTDEAKHDELVTELEKSLGAGRATMMPVLPFRTEPVKTNSGEGTI